MDTANLFYTIGLLLVVFYLAMGIDDFFWDIANLVRRSQKSDKFLDISQLDSVPPKLLAIVVAAWHEENVLGDVIDNIIVSTQYPKSMYHIFLGIYPNDADTLAVANSLAKRHSNVHVIINCEPGPTSKAQNINHMIREIKIFEQKRKWSFASITIHDSEDVVHPYEVKVTNYLLDYHDVMQFPVFALIKRPTFANFFANITSGTYADEFAENHFITMVNRRNLGALVPSAGTGFVLSRKVLEMFGNEDVLPRDSLTEDYRLALTFYEKGIQAYYVLERVPRITENKELVWDFIATRSMFPNTFKTAVKQKTRWVLGITMQSFRFKDIFQTGKMGFIGRYSLYRDLKPKIGNLLVFVGYPVLLYFLASFFIPTLTPIYPVNSLGWYLSLGVTVMMIERQLFKGVAIYNVYGMKSVFFACLFPPIVSVRTVWGNLINMVATFNAHKQNIFGNQKNAEKNKQVQKQPLASNKVKEKKKFAWVKTDHSFLDKDILKRFHRRLGDILLEKGYITPQQLETALHDLQKNPMPYSMLGNLSIKYGIIKNEHSPTQEPLPCQMLGDYLLNQSIITEEQLMVALASIKSIPYVESSSLTNYNLAQHAYFFEENILRRLLIVPLLKTKTGFVIAFCDRSPENAQTILRQLYDIEIKAVFMSEESIQKALDYMYTSAPRTLAYSLIIDLFEQGSIGYEQAIIAGNYKTLLSQKDTETLESMGLMLNETNLVKVSVEEAI